MSLLLYADHNFHAAITAGLRRAGVDVLTSIEDASTELEDSAVVDRATALGRVVMTHDHDFIREAVSRQIRGIRFAGVIHVHPMRMTIGQAVAELSVVALVCEPEEFENRLEYLPL